MNAPARLAFLADFERLLTEAPFVDSYKFALLIALAELAVERGDDSMATLTLPIRDIAAQFVTIYWRQAMPFGNTIGDGASSVLMQNPGRKAGMIMEVTKLRAQYSSLHAARSGPHWQRSLTRISAGLEDLPIKRLQRLRQGSLPFLYAYDAGSGTIELLPGVAANLRYFHGLVVRAVQGEWLRFVQSMPANQRLLGATTDLSEFLFGSDRSGLERARDRLRMMQADRCFYCESPLRESVEVAHFIPWSRYRRDLVHNLVAVHPACNAHKGELLAAGPLRERWAAWTGLHDTDLADIGAAAGLIVDRQTALRVAEWSYAQARRVGADVWLGGRQYGTLQDAEP